MSEKFDRNQKLPPHEDIRKISYLMSSGEIRIDFHRVPGHIIAPSILFKKVDSSYRIDEEYLRHKDKQSQPTMTAQQIVGLAQMQKESVVRWRQAVELTEQIKECRRHNEYQICLMRRQLGQKQAAVMLSVGSDVSDKPIDEITGPNGTLQKHVYDVARERARDESFRERPQEQAEEYETAKVDVLAPYLLEYQSKPIDASAAEAIVKRCKADFRKRLLDRAAIIQNRLEEEHEQLKKQRSALQRRGDNQEKDERAVEHYQSEAMFRIQILEQRMARHEMQAIRKFSELEKTLAEDRRLSALWTKR
eukprot:GHVQ01040251.1.p1 GENE.GHVQ01040251.1~~GHVQ01040251.1.p1  ORF type:complete len:306 (+),score=58.57 GHVQ01040251.1:265-1182(+)